VKKNTYAKENKYLNESPNDSTPSFGPFIRLAALLRLVGGLVEERTKWEERRREEQHDELKINIIM